MYICIVSICMFNIYFFLLYINPHELIRIKTAIRIKRVQKI